jgi:hypothetical protein
LPKSHFCSSTGIDFLFFIPAYCGELPAQRLALPAGDLDRLDPAGQGEIAPFCWNQPQAMQTA